MKLWKVSERDKRPEGYNLKDEDGRLRDPSMITSLRVSSWRGAFLMGLGCRQHWVLVGAVCPRDGAACCWGHMGCCSAGGTDTL